VRRALDDDGCYRLDIDGETFELGVGDLDVRATAHDELVLAQEAGVAVALDTTVDDELRLEGLARELVRAINDHRKALGLELSDRITVELHCTGELAVAARQHREWVMGEVLAVELDVHDDAGGESMALLPVGDAACRVVVKRISGDA
jgi:isoleucyl-tRNA synthetase